MTRATAKPNTNRRRSGLAQWAKHPVACFWGCSYNCRYCYARANAVGRNRKASGKTVENWPAMTLDAKAAGKRFGKRSGRFVFPSRHDITPETLAACTDYLKRILEPGNEVLIVTKADIRVMENLTRDLADHADRIEFRITIGSLSDETLKFWEPGAPNFQSRLLSLQAARLAGYRTSVSAEPFLDSTVDGVLAMTDEYITGTFWLGTLRNLNARVDLASLRTRQFDQFVRPLMIAHRMPHLGLRAERMIAHLKVRLKDSILEILRRADSPAVDTTRILLTHKAHTLEDESACRPEPPTCHPERSEGSGPRQ